MKPLSQTRTTREELGSKILAIDKLTEHQKELMKCAIGQGLWEQILEGKPIPSSVIDLITEKMRYSRLLPKRSCWQE